ncbi:MAG: ribonuclease III, partial [Clostridia bacterium]|nr:ribonuclease III [Clostridia bacterium]
SPRFIVNAKINSNVVGHGEGSTKREAEQLAAKDALLLFGISEDDE